MYLTILKSKLHRATVTEANLNYTGSITIDRDLMDTAGIVVHEKVQVVNNNNGARFETYVIEGKRGSGTICLNGAAARLVQPGDTVIIMAYAHMTPEEAANYKPSVLLLGDNNRVLRKITETAGQTVDSFF
ncbi:MAG TPA: aspartate 1-decarboxylase [Bacteroidales bacterium]|jgi:aspartate 1-decarboxylase|nr:aspartate 1-decarboxylase [Bacteroidales bacterium]